MINANVMTQVWGVVEKLHMCVFQIFWASIFSRITKVGASIDLINARTFFFCSSLNGPNMFDNLDMLMSAKAFVEMSSPFGLKKRITDFKRSHKTFPSMCFSSRQKTVRLEFDPVEGHRRLKIVFVTAMTPFEKVCLVHTSFFTPPLLI